MSPNTSIRPAAGAIVLVIAATIALAGLFGTTSASAATSVNVNPFFGCPGGTRTVPAGSTIVISIGQATSTRGLAQDYMNDVTTLLSVNGAPIVDADALYRTGPIEFPDGSWQTRFTYPTGITLSSGQSLTFSYDEVLAHQFHDGFMTDTEHQGDRPLFGGPGSIFGGPLSCTVTAA
jgi:hypothetical protein